MTPKRFLLTIIVIIVLIAAGGVGFYFWSHDTFNRGSISVIGNVGSEDLAEGDIPKIVQAVSKHIILPQGEEPVAAKITNVDELLKTQQFYRGAINGDILLIYQVASKAILYSPSRGMLVNVGPVILDEAAAASLDAASAEVDTQEEGGAEDVQ